MSKLVTDDGRTHIQSRLMRESLVDRKVIARTDSEREFEIMPNVVLVGIGGQSIFDRGKGALLPLVEEISALRGKHRLMLGVGGGTRVRHTVSIALDLGVPTGGVAQLVGAMEEANAVFLNALLAKHRSIVMQREHFWELPLYIENGMLPIVISIPPYHFWEPPPEDGPLPAHGSDFGLFILAEVLGMSRVVFVKDEDGLYTENPKTSKSAAFIPKISVDEMKARGLHDSILEFPMLDLLKAARHVRQVQVVNGLVPGNLTRALAGEHVGTIITAS